MELVNNKKDVVELTKRINDTKKIVVCNLALNEDTLIALLNINKRIVIFPFNIDYDKSTHLIISSNDHINGIFSLQLEYLVRVADSISNIPEFNLPHTFYINYLDNKKYFFLKWDLTEKSKKLDRINIKKEIL